MAKKRDIVSRLADLLIDLTKRGQLEWRFGEMNHKTGDFRARHKDYVINLEGVYSVQKEDYFRFRLIPRRFLECFDREIGFRTYRVSNKEQPETYMAVARLVEQIRHQLDVRLLSEVAG